jgi:phosphotransferase system enzyme I (PtsI)
VIDGIDGIDGCVIIDPSAETIREYEARRDAVARERRGFARLRKLPAITRDGVAKASAPTGSV